MGVEITNIFMSEFFFVFLFHELKNLVLGLQLWYLEPVGAGADLFKFVLSQY